MNDKIRNYIDGIFAPYDGIKSVSELKDDLLMDLLEQYSELKEQGKDNETAFAMTVESIGDIEETVMEVANLSRSLERKVFTNFSASNLPKSDFSNVVAHGGTFKASALRGSNFSDADLTGSSFDSSDVRDANFDRTNLTDCSLSCVDLSNSSFCNSILLRTNFNASGLDGVKFVGVKLTDVKLTTTDLRKTTFENCVFRGVDFKYSDVSSVCFDEMTFIDVKFDKSALTKTSFKGAILKNVSFLSPIIWSKKYYRSIKTICFDGTMMDKLTYTALKGVDADLSKVIIL